VNVTRRSLVLAAGLASALACFARPACADELFLTSEHTTAPGERAVVRVRTDATGSATALLYRVEGGPELFRPFDFGDGAALYARFGDLLDAVRRNAGNTLPPLAREPRVADGPVPTITFISSRAVALTKDAAAAPGQSIDVPIPASGIYLIEVRAGTRGALVTALVSRLAVVTKRDPRKLVVFATDRTTGTPIEGVEVSVPTRGGPLTGKTDAKGLVALEGALPATTEVTARLDDDFAFGHETYVPADVATRRVYAFPHQPAYRPGERVEVKGVVRARRDGRYELDADVREVAITFKGGDGQDLGKTTAAVSADLGTFAAGFDLPRTASTGDAFVVVDAGGKAYAAPFRIDEYRKPVFEVKVAPASARVAAGDPLEFDVAASLYEGGAVAGGALAWTVAYSRVDRELFPTDELARLFFGTEREAYAPEPIANGNATLNASGKAHVSVAIPLHAQDGYLAIRATVTGPDRTAVAGSGGVGYSAVPLTVALKTDKHLYGPEATAVVTVRAQKADGSPAAGRSGVITAAVVREHGPAGGAPEERETASIAFTTAADGSASIQVPFAENGRYRVAVAIARSDAEPAGPPAAASLHVYVVGDRSDVGFSGDQVELIADRDDYAVGDTARVLVLSPVGSRPALTTVEGPALFAYDTTPLLEAAKSAAGAAAILDVKITDEHVPNVYVGATLVDHGHVLTATRLLRVPPVARRLTAVVHTARTEFEPGTKIPMTLEVTDSKGAPVAGAEVAVAIVDDSLYGLFADPAVALEPFFHSIRRNDVRTGGPIDLESVGWSVAPPVPAKEMAGRDAPGADADAPRPAPAAGAVPPPATPAAPEPSPTEAPALGPVGDPAMGEVGGGGGVRLARRAGLVGTTREERAESKSKDSKGDSDGEGPLEARADFRTAVLWSPSVRTGPDGKASLGEVAFGDALTRWRITSRAIDAATRVGTSVATVRTVKRVLTRLTLPRFLRVDDRVDAPWTLHSLLEQPTEATYVASATGVALEGPSGGTSSLAAGALETKSLRLHATKTGEASVSAELRTGPGSDAVRQSFPVLPQGITKVLTSFGRSSAGEAITLPSITLPPTADRPSARLEIRVAPSEAQAVAAALPYLLDYPYGCTEQTMSRLVPVVVAKAAQDAFGIRPAGKLADVDAMIDRGLARLRALRHADGGFGWWEKDASDPYMTAYVVHGLSRVLASKDDTTAKDLQRAAAQWLVGWRAKSSAGEPRPMSATDAFVVMALADARAIAPTDLPPAVHDGIVSIPPLARAFLLRAARALGREDDVKVHLAALLARATVDAAGARFVADDAASPARWETDPIETTAWALGAILAADPRQPLLAEGSRWLLGQRVDGAHWNSTRDTAACVAYLTRHAAATTSVGAGRTALLTVNGLRLKPVTFGAAGANAFADDPTIVLDVPNAPVEVRVEPDAGALDVSATLRFTDTGPAIEAASSGLRVERTFWLVEPASGGQKGMKRARIEEAVPTRSLLDVDVTVTVDRAAEFVMVESPHAAGFEPELDFEGVYEGGVPKAVLADHVDRRDDRTVFFVKSLAPGTYVFRHRVRATHVGSFTALPASAEQMYAPAIHGSGRGEVLEIDAAGPAARPGGGK